MSEVQLKYEDGGVASVWKGGEEDNAAGVRTMDAAMPARIEKPLIFVRSRLATDDVWDRG